MMSDPDQERVERYEALRAELADLDDAALKERFWQLCEQVMTPVVDLARTHTTPSIERSVLLRMGIDSVTTNAVVENVFAAGLGGKGAGHAVLRLSRRDGMDLRDAVTRIAEDPKSLDGLFDGSPLPPQRHRRNPRKESRHDHPRLRTSGTTVASSPTE